jgi:hypothetical protein
MSRQEQMLAKKGRGRPATGRGTTIGVRCHDEMLAAIDEWRRRQPDQPTRATAIRSLAAATLQMLARDPGEKPARGKKSASKAHDMAGQQIDALADSSATHEERQQRKRRLLKGPGEFRDIRGDLPKRKG